MNGWCHVLIWFTSCIDLRVGGIITCLRVCPSYDIMSLFSNQCRVAIAKAIINSNVTINKKVISGKSQRLIKKGKETKNRKSTTKEIISKPLFISVTSPITYKRRIYFKDC